MAEKENVEVTEEYTHGRQKYDPVSGVKRGLKTRHVSMMALAGIIGPGAFLGLSRAFNSGGPVGLLVGFAIVGTLVLIMMCDIREMSVLFDFNFNSHASRWVDPAFGAALGWSYVFLWCCTLISEYVSICSALGFYSEKVPFYGYFLILWLVFTVYQLLAVNIFGEVEYILAWVKIIIITAFYIFAIIFAAGGIPGHSPGNPFRDYPLADGFKGIANSFVYAAVFYVGIEGLSMTYSELRDVKSAVKKLVLQTVVRIFYVYFGLSIAYGITVAYNDPLLLSSNRVFSSVQTIAFLRAGWSGGGYYVTTCILVTCISSINSAVYITARTAMRLSVEGYGPKILGKVSKNGVPWVACTAVHLTAFLAMLSMNSTSSVAYSYIIGLAGVSAFIVWTGIIYSHLRFRKGWLKQGNTLEELPFPSPFYPYTDYFGIGLGIFLCLVQGWTVFKPFDAGQFVDLYIMIPLTPLLYFAIKWWKKTKWVKYEDMDFDSNRVDLEETWGGETVQPEKKNVVLNVLRNYI